MNLGRSRTRPVSSFYYFLSIFIAACIFSVDGLLRPISSALGSLPVAAGARLVQTVNTEGIPKDITSVDKIAASVLDTLAASPEILLVPDTTINTLTGGDNLGVLLWAFVLYNGIFPVAGRPADWLLPFVAQGAGVDVDLVEEKGKTIDSDSKNSWYLDYKAGYKFVVPPEVELFRFGLFGALAFYFNAFVISSLGGDSFWGWSVGACMLIPSALINAAREQPPTRQEAALAMKLEQEFVDFAEARIVAIQKPENLDSKVCMYVCVCMYVYVARCSVICLSVLRFALCVLRFAFCYMDH